MPYTSDIPKAADRPSQSQSEIKDNFGAINTVVAVNHVAFNAVGEGKHKWVTMPDQAATPPVGAFAAGEVGMYASKYDATSKNELYVNKTNQATVTQIPATASSLSITSSPASDTAGWSMLPSGVLIKWGYASGITGIATVNYDATVVFQAVFSVMLTPNYFGGSNDRQVVIRANGNAGFQVESTLLTNLGTNATSSFYYFAIGRP